MSPPDYIGEAPHCYVGEAPPGNIASRYLRKPSFDLLLPAYAVLKK